MRFILLVLLVISSSCSSNRMSFAQVASASQDCQGLFEFLKNSWKKNKEGYFYFDIKFDKYNNPYKSARMTDCLRGKTKKEIEKLFNAPSGQALNRYYYYMSAECSQGEPARNFDRRCLLLIIEFDRHNLVMAVSPITRYRAPIP